MSKFKFELGAEVALTKSGESGQVIGRAEYLTSEPSYSVRLLRADGRQVDEWFAESALAE